ncbi:MAG: hypothetical protein ACRC9Q_09875 [Bacteroidales bacterium]
MKKNKYILLTALTLLSSEIVSAQTEKKEKQEETIERELLIEKQFTPIVRDASKITQLPAVEAPKGEANKSTEFAFWSVTGKPLYEVNPLEPAAIGTNMEFSDQKGYASLAMGNLWNIDAALGYTFLRNPDTELSATYDFYNTAGSRQSESAPKANYKMFQNKFNLNLNQRISKIRLLANVAYNQAQFNQPVFTFAPDQPAEIDNGLNRKNNQVKVNLAIPQIRFSDTYAMKLWAGYSFFQKKNFGFLDYNIASQTENAVHFGTDLYGNILGNLKAGALVQVTSWGTKGASMNTALQVTPKIGVNLDNFDLLVGVGLQFNPKAEELPALTAPALLRAREEEQSQRFNIYPEIRINWNVVPSTSLYATITGRSELATFENSDALCYYATPVNSRYMPVLNNIRFDAQVGVRTLIANSLALELFGGAVRYEDAVFAKTMFVGNQGFFLVPGVAPDFWSVRYGLKADLAIGSRLNLGAQIQGATQMNYIQQPNMTADFSIGYRPVKPLLLDLSFRFLGERKAETSSLLAMDYENGVVTSSDPVSVKMKAASLLKLKAVYDINDFIVAHISANNLLNQKYDLWYGLPAQGIHFLAGATVKF